MMNDDDIFPSPGGPPGALGALGACRSSRENPQRAFESARTSEVDHNATPPGGYRPLENQGGWKIP